MGMKKTARLRPAIGREQGGFSIVEVMLGAAVLIIASAGGLRSMVDAMKVREVNRENSIAHLAARGAIESMRVTDFEDIFATYNTSGLDDPAGLNSAPGAGFAVLGLDPQGGDLDGFVGRIEFPVNAAGTGRTLFENYADSTFGLPRDLTGDGVVDGDDHATDYRLLPVRAIVEWSSASGSNRSLTFETYLCER
jgi:type II secretory pathway pseudopilin PulG